MNTIFAPAALAMSSMLFTSLWEGAIIVAAVWFGLRCLPKLGASNRYAIWLCTLVIIAVAPVATTFISSSSSSPSISVSAGTAGSQVVGARIAPEAVPRRAAQAMPSAPPRRYIDVPLLLSVFISLLWLAIAGTRGVILIGHASALARMRHSAVWVREAFGYAVLASDRATVPLAIGFFRPAVMLPSSLEAELSAEAIDAIVMHEAAHLRRYDVWTNALARILETAVVLNPIGWFVSHRLSVEREIACDDWVVSRFNAGEVLARAIAEIACRPVRRSLAAPSAIGSKHAVVERIEQLLDRRPRRLQISVLALAGTLALLLAFTTVVPIFSPVLAFAQESSSAAGASCTHEVMMQPLDFKTGKPSNKWVPLKPDAKLAADPRSTVADVTVDASGKLTNVKIISSPHHRDAVAAKRFFEQMVYGYRPAVVNCRPVTSTVHFAFVIDIAPPAPISIVSAAYPNGWSRQNPGACRVPDLTHGGVPNVNLTNSKTLSASVRVDVDPSGRAVSASIVRPSGDTTYDDATLAAAKSYVYPLNESTGFKPVRPNGATLAWNAANGYSKYSKCTPLPTEYSWTTTFPPADK